MNKTPVFPRPAKSKASAFAMFILKRSSWLEGLYERSYKMKMGEVKGFGSTIYMVNEPHLVKKILVEEWQNYPKHSALSDVLLPLLGESIFTTNGAQWRKQRDMLEPSFANARIQTVFSLMQDAATALTEQLHEGEIDVDPHMTHVTADIIFRTIFSTPLKKKDADIIFEAFTQYQFESPKRIMGKLFNIPDFLFKFWGESKRQKSAKIIREKIASLIKPRYDNHDTSKQDILGTILEARDKETGKRFSFEEILNQICMLFLAGHETSASSLMWALYLLSLDKVVQQQCYEEVRGQNINFAALRSFDAIKNVFREALRLYPPVGFYMREAKCPVTMRDKKIPKGGAILIAPWLIQRHEEYWEKPNEFCPARFDDEGSKQSIREAYLPFSQGARVCIGAAFALQEATLILSTILQEYEILPHPNFEPKPVGRLTIRSDNGMRLIFKKRNEI